MASPRPRGPISPGEGLHRKDLSSSRAEKRIEYVFQPAGPSNRFWYQETGRIMEGSISHERSEETPEAKARWFQSLSLSERMDIFCEITEFILSVNPGIVERKHAEPPSGRIRILSIPRS